MALNRRSGPVLCSARSPTAFDPRGVPHSTPMSGPCLRRPDDGTSRSFRPSGSPLMPGSCPSANNPLASITGRAQKAEIGGAPVGDEDHGQDRRADAQRQQGPPHPQGDALRYQAAGLATPFIPSEMTLGDLHQAIQAAMGWEGGHLHAFDIAGRQYGDPDSLDEVADEERLTLNKVRNTGVRRFTYTYDFGDNWEHTVLIERPRRPLEAGR